MVRSGLRHLARQIHPASHIVVFQKHSRPLNTPTGIKSSGALETDPANLVERRAVQYPLQRYLTADQE
jgi:hypothetical protein